MKTTWFSPIWSVELPFRTLPVFSMQGAPVYSWRRRRGTRCVCNLQMIMIWHSTDSNGGIAIVTINRWYSWKVQMLLYRWTRHFQGWSRSLRILSRTGSAFIRLSICYCRTWLKFHLNINQINYNTEVFNQELINHLLQVIFTSRGITLLQKKYWDVVYWCSAGVWLFLCDTKNTKQNIIKSIIY